MKWLGRTALAWLAVIVLSFGPDAQAAELVAPAKLDALAQEAIDSGWIYGLAVSLINENGTQIAGYGRTSEDNPKPPDAQTVFEIGSITKVFTGLVLAQLVEDGTVKLDEPVQELLGESITVPKFGQREITLVDVTTHSSGLPSMPSDFLPKNLNDPYADYTVEQMANYLGKHKLRREPGAQYEYSNLAVGLLGHALALKNGTSYEAMVSKRICEPLGMNDTRITLDDALRARLATGHDVDGKAAENWNIPTLAGAGALRSTTNDMLKFLAANLGLAKTPFDAAIAASHAIHFKLPDGGGVALGWHVQGDGAIWHNGGTGGYHSFTGFRPDKKAGIIVLSNSQVPLVDLVGQRLLDLLVSGEAKPLKLPRAIQLDAAAIEPLAGKYKLPGSFRITVVREGDALSLTIPGQDKLKLYPESATRFFTRMDPELAFTFEIDAAARPTGLIVHMGGRDIAAPREVDVKQNEEKREPTKTSPDAEAPGT